MKIKNTQFIKSAVRPAHYPEWDLNEVAFAGRSNVGKSSLINTLLMRKALVKVSKTPGRTQLLNFFEVTTGDDRQLGLVDLPGYGFARVPDSVKRTWGKMIEGYLERRERLKAVVIVMDIRRGMTVDDRHMLESLAFFGPQPILVFTKADKFSANKRRNQILSISKKEGIPKKDMIIFSSHNRMGREALWERIAGLCLPQPLNFGPDGDELPQEEGQG